MASHPFDRLEERCRELDSRVCAGLDLHLDLVPGLDLRDPVAGCRRFLFEVLEALDGVVPAVKPQIAFFEQLGPDGLALYFDVAREAHRRGALVIGDIKRGDIGSTAAAYARAHFGAEGGAAADFVTLSPYLGIDSIRPFLELGRAAGRGVFVLARTSNASSRDFQNLEVGGEPLFLAVGRTLEGWGGDCVGDRGYTDVGAVVGATHPDEGRQLRTSLRQTFFLIPGYGAQGGTAEDVAGMFAPDGSGAIVSSSRGILFAGRQRPDLTPAEAARAEAIRMATTIQTALGNAGHGPQTAS